MARRAFFGAAAVLAGMFSACASTPATDTNREGPTTDAPDTESIGDADAPDTADAAAAEPPLPEIDAVQWVDALIGTSASNAPNAVPGGAGGSTFPGASAPFGMVQWSPDSTFAKSDPDGQYTYDDDVITGFSLTHYDGAGCRNNGDVPFLPITQAGQTSAKFSHDDEHASAGAYDVTLSTGIKVELTATTRTGFARLTYPTGSPAMLVIDANRSATDRNWAHNPSLQRQGTSSIVGSTNAGDFCGSSKLYRINFVVTFEHPIKSVEINDGKAIVTFDTSADNVVRAKVGLSYVSAENAQKNLDAESPDWDFDSRKDATRKAWNTRLNAIQVDEGSDDAKKKFYTALFHSFQFPSFANDVNGEYMGFDNVVHTVAAGHSQYANYSGWDIYRSQVQLLAMLFPAEASDMLQSLVVDAQQCGAFPKWSQNNVETNVMVGDPGSLIISNGHAFGAKNFDTSAALSMMMKVGEAPGARCNGALELPGLASYLAREYIADLEEQGPASTTLEYTSRDFAVGKFAEALGDTTTARMMAGRAAYWQSEIHPNGLLETRDLNGAWHQPLEGPGGGAYVKYIEGNAEQYTWMVPYDLRHLFDALGGNAAVVPRLDAFFSVLNAGVHDPNFYIGNEPSFSTPWIYDWSGTPWRTQDVVRRIVDESFTTGPGGLPGNDDLGATSSWLVFAMIGLFPEIPGVPGFAVGSPVFGSTAIQLQSSGARHIVRIHAKGAPARYVQTMMLGGKAYARPWLPLDVIAGGATLDVELGTSPSQWGSTEPPPSYGPGDFAAVADAHNAIAIGSDANHARADFDGLGFSYSSEALAAAGLTSGASVSRGGATFQWPGAGLDNMVAVGQTVSFPSGTRGGHLALLGAANHGAATGNFVVTYADGTTSTLAVTLGDWTLNGGSSSVPNGNEIAATAAYRNGRAGRDNTKTFVFSTTVGISSSKDVASVKLPAWVSAGKMHVFAMTIAP